MGDAIHFILDSDRGSPVDAFVTLAIDIHFNDHDVVAVGVQFVEVGRDRAARRAILTREIKDHGFTRHQILGDIHFLAEGDPFGFSRLW